ncbi:MAG: NUDIX hydrolase [Gemmatimonadota bacterium]
MAHWLAARIPREESDPSLIRAAVAVVLAPEPDSVLLIRRVEREGDPWSGHIALPGGRKDPRDPDLLATAVRETLEEVGLDLTGATLLGRLDDLAPYNPVLPPLVVRPFAFQVPERHPLTTSDEVAAAFWTDLDLLLAPDVRQPVSFTHRGAPVTLPGYRLPEGMLWGMTERILTPVIEAIREPR